MVDTSTIVPPRRHRRTASSKPLVVPAASITTSQLRDDVDREPERFGGAPLGVVARA